MKNASTLKGNQSRGKILIIQLARDPSTASIGFSKGSLMTTFIKGMCDTK